MKRFDKTCIEDIVSIASLTLSPVPGKAAFNTHRPNLKKDKYDIHLWELDTVSGETRQLTHGAAEGGFCYIENGQALLFPGLREQCDRDRVQAGEELTAFYRLPLAGGEAHEFFRLSIAAGSVTALSGGKLLITAKHDLSRPDLSALKGEELSQALADIRAEREFHVCDEYPYRYDGRGYINKTRTRLYVYDLASGELSAVTEPCFDTGAFCVSQCGEFIVFAGNSFDVSKPLADKLYTYCVKSGQTTCLAQTEYTIAGVAHVGDRVFYNGMDIDFSSDICSVPLSGGEQVVEYVVQEDMGFQNSGDSCRGGGTAFVGAGDDLYFTKSDRKGTHLFKMQAGSQPERLTNGDVWVNHFAVEQSGRVLCAGLPAFGPMEIFATENGVSKAITSVNQNIAQKYDLCPSVYQPYTSRDGTDLDGWVILPHEAKDKKVPAILLIHGGPRGQYQGTLNFDAQVLASAGYAVLFCNIRGSSSRSRDFANLNGKYGTVDFDDLMDFVDACLAAHPQIDAHRLGVTGASYGGYMTNWIVTHTDRFRAGVAQCSISNWVSMYGCSDVPWFVARGQGGLPWDGHDALWRTSPLAHVKNAKTPLLLLQYMADHRCPPDQAYQMYQAMLDMGVDTRMVLFEGDSHGMILVGKPTHRVRRHTEMLTWMDKYVK